MKACPFGYHTTIFQFLQKQPALLLRLSLHSHRLGVFQRWKLGCDSVFSPCLRLWRTRSSRTIDVHIAGDKTQSVFVEYDCNKYRYSCISRPQRVLRSSIPKEILSSENVQLLLPHRPNPSAGPARSHGIPAMALLVPSYYFPM